MTSQYPFQELASSGFVELYRVRKFPDLTGILCRELIGRRWRWEIASAQENCTLLSQLQYLPNSENVPTAGAIQQLKSPLGNDVGTWVSTLFQALLITRYPSSNVSDLGCGSWLPQQDFLRVRAHLACFFGPLILLDEAWLYGAGWGASRKSYGGDKYLAHSVTRFQPAQCKL